jgi:YD repeat-containing protein
MKTHRDKEGLLGPVHTVRTHVTKLPAKIARPDTSGRTLEQMITYDSEGRKLEETIYGENGVIQSRKVYVRDPSQHTGWITYDSNGSLQERLVCVHDPDGRRAEHLTYGRDGKLERRQVTSHDKENKRCDSASYTADGTLISKHVTIYDDQEREIEKRMEMWSHEHRTVATYSDSGDTFELAWYSGDTLGSRFVMANPEGPISQVFHYDGDGILQSRETIERLKFDDHGNWTEERVSTYNKVDPTEVEPTELHHRVITYY